MNQQNMYAPNVNGQPMAGTPIGNPNIPYMGQPVNFQGKAGYGYTPTPPIKVTQPVTREESNYLKKTEDQLDMRITKTESIKNSCTHKDPDTGVLALVDIGGGLVKCRVCDEVFHLIEPQNMTEDAIKAKVDEVIDIMQSAKAMYLSAPEQFTTEFYQVISLLKKLPKIFTKSAGDYAKYDIYAASGGVAPVYGQAWATAGDPFAVYNSLLMSTPGGYQQPYGGYYPYNNPYGYQQPVYAPYQQPPQYGQTIPGYQAQQPYGYQATPPAPQPAPQQPVGAEPTYKPQWMTNYVDPITGASINPNTPQPAPQQPYGYQATPTMPNDNPLGYGAPVSQPAPVQAPAPVTPPTSPVPNAGTEDIIQTKKMTI